MTATSDGGADDAIPAGAGRARSHFGDFSSRVLYLWSHLPRETRQYTPIVAQATVASITAFQEQAGETEVIS